MGMGPTSAAPSSRYKQRSQTPGVGYTGSSYNKSPGKPGASPGGKGGTGYDQGSMLGAGISTGGIYNPSQNPKQISQPGGPGGQLPGKGGAGPGMGGQLPPGGHYSDDGNWYQPPMPTAPDGMAQAQVMPQPIWTGQGPAPWGSGWGGQQPIISDRGGGMYGSIMDKLQGNQGFLDNFSPERNAGQLQAMQQRLGRNAHSDPRYRQLLAERDAYGQQISQQNPVTDTTVLMQKKYGNQLGGPGKSVDAVGGAPAIAARPQINRDPRNMTTYGPAPNILKKSSPVYSKDAFEDAMRNYDEVMANGPSDPRFGVIVRGGNHYWKDLGLSSATGGDDGRGFYDKKAARAYALQHFGRSGFTG